jgi:hypothetical protein
LFTSVDLVRFGWEDSGVDGPTKVISNVTIWVGAQDNTTTGDVAFESSQDILSLLTEHGIDDVDVAFRESEARFLTGSPLLAPSTMTTTSRMSSILPPLLLACPSLARRRRGRRELWASISALARIFTA